jgi:hypothetical protein
MGDEIQPPVPHSAKDKSKLSPIMNGSASSKVLLSHSSPQTTASELSEPLSDEDTMERGEPQIAVALSDFEQRKRMLGFSYKMSILKIKKSLQAAQQLINPRNFWEWEPSTSPAISSMPAASNVLFLSKSADSLSSTTLLAKSWDEGRMGRQFQYSTFSITAD